MLVLKWRTHGPGLRGAILPLLLMAAIAVGLAGSALADGSTGRSVSGVTTMRPFSETGCCPLAHPAVDRRPFSDESWTPANVSEPAAVALAPVPQPIAPASSTVGYQVTIGALSASLFAALVMLVMLRRRGTRFRGPAPAAA